MGYGGTVCGSYLEAHTAADAMLLLVFHELNGTASSGELLNAHIPEAIPFYGFGDLLLKMERIYDLLQLPQSLRRIRRLSDTGRWEDTNLSSSEGWDMGAGTWVRFQREGVGKLSLIIQVLYRQHGSWQGFISIKNQKIFFQSALELLHLIDDCVRETMGKEVPKNKM